MERHRDTSWSVCLSVSVVLFSLAILPIFAQLGIGHVIVSFSMPFSSFYNGVES